MYKAWPVKDPNEVLDYSFDWSPRKLSGDIIESTTATVISGSVVVDTHEKVSNKPLITTTWLSGGDNGENCLILLRIVTTAGRILEETVSIKIKSR
jgi:hypothetical protein